MEHAETIALLVALQDRMTAVNARLDVTLARLAALLQRRRDDDHHNGA